MSVSAGLDSYSVRANAFETERAWHLGADALELRGLPTGSPNGVIRFPCREIRELRLSFAPTRFDWARYRCELFLKSGQRIAIQSTHYCGIADFEDRKTAYVPFIRALIARIANANAACRFRSGKRPTVYALEHAFLLAMFALLVVVLGMVGGVGLGQLALIKLAIIGCYLPLMLLYTRKNWPRRFDPRDIPDNLLPSANAPVIPRARAASG